MSIAIGDWVELWKEAPLYKLYPYTKGKVQEIEEDQALIRFVESFDDKDSWWVPLDNVIVCPDPTVVHRETELDQWVKTEENMKRKRDDILRGIFSDKKPAEDVKTDPFGIDINKWVTFLETADEHAVHIETRGYGYVQHQMLIYTPYGTLNEGGLCSEFDLRLRWWNALSKRSSYCWAYHD